jgi:hypothetical protein
MSCPSVLIAEEGKGFVVSAFVLETTFRRPTAILLMVLQPKRLDTTGYENIIPILKINDIQTIDARLWN